MSLAANAKAIQAATRELARKWDETRQFWTDAKSAEFERAYLAELFTQVERSVPVMEELEKIVQRVRRECE